MRRKENPLIRLLVVILPCQSNLSACGSFAKRNKNFVVKYQQKHFFYLSHMDEVHVLNLIIVDFHINRFHRSFLV